MIKGTQFAFSVHGHEQEFRVESFQAHEKLFQPFEVNLSLLSSDADIAFEDLIRKPAVLTLFGQGAGESRVFHGIVNEVRFLGTGRRFSRYNITLVPQAWFLAQRQDCRIFQGRKINDIIAKVLDDAGVSDYRFELSRTYLSKEYILQYRETDLHFIHRLMSQHGMWYYFEHSSTAHTMVIVDSNDAILALPTTIDNATVVGPVWYHSAGGGISDREHIFDVDFGKRVRTGEVILSDYNYHSPKIPQKVTSTGTVFDDLAYFDYPGRYTNPVEGKVQSGDRVSGHIVDNCQLEGQSCIMRFIPGYSIEMDRHPRASLNSGYTLVAVTHSGEDPQVHEEESSGSPTTYYNQFVCIPADVTYRVPNMPPPIVDGPQTAVVVGPSGEEIYTDEMGRIKVQFHWDRYGKSNEKSSCWIRVSQSMAAPGWGAVYLPRIGHEVVVNFLEGDPDRPLVTGAVYNGLHQPPHSLPANKTRTTFRTQTHKGEGYNELSFDDEANREEVYIRAQRDISTEVLNNQYYNVGNDELVKIGRNQTNEVKGDQKQTIQGNKTTIVKTTYSETVEQDVTVNHNANETRSVEQNVNLDIGKNRTTKIGNNDELNVEASSNLTVGGSRTVEVTSNDSLNIGGNVTVSVKGNTSCTADGATQIVSGEKIILRAGDSQLVMNSNGSIKLSGLSIVLEGSDKVVVKGGKVAVN